MKQKVKLNINEYTESATGLNKAGLFARVAQYILFVNLVRGGDFYNRYAQ